jgi:hypothetical protein
MLKLHIASKCIVVATSRAESTISALQLCLSPIKNYAIYVSGVEKWFASECYQWPSHD